MKYLAKRVGVLILAFIIMLQSVQVSFAAGGDLNGNGSGNSYTDSTEQYVSSYHAFQCLNGIRFYLFSGKTNRICSNVIDMVSSFPYDVQSSGDLVLNKLWPQYRDFTGTFTKKKTNIVYLAGAKVDSTFAYNIGTMINPGEKDGVYGVAWDENGNASLEPGKMYLYSDIEYALKNSLDDYYIYENDGIYKEEYEASGGSPIDPNIMSGTYTNQDGITFPRQFQGPVQNGMVDGQIGNVATGDTFKAQMSTELPDGKTVLQHLVNLELRPTNQKGDVIGQEDERLLAFTDPDIQAEYEAELADGNEDALMDVLKNNEVYIGFEPLCWQINEIIASGAPAGYNGNNQNSFWNTPYIVYGTPTNVTWWTALQLNNYIHHFDDSKNINGYRNLSPEMVEFLNKSKQAFPDYYEVGYSNWIKPFTNWLDANGIGQTWDWGLSYQAFTLSEPLITDKSKVDTFEERGLDKTNINNDIGGNLSFWLNNAYTLGYGFMVFKANPETGTSSWDEDIYSEDGTNGVYSPGPAPDESNNGGNELKNNIVKFYARKDGNNNYVYQENHTRMNTISPIEIEDEESYLVDSWYVSDTFKQPTKSNDSYDIWKNSMNNTQTGTSEETVEINAGQTLYIRLVESLRVIKVYETDGNVDKIKIETPILDGDKYKVITPDNGYNYTESFISPESKDITRWNDIPTNGTPSEDLTLKIPDTTKVIYIRYTKDSSNNALVLHENEISHNFNLRDITGNLLKTTRHYKYISVPECDYFYDCGCSDDDDSCDCWSCNEDMDQESPGTYYFEVVNKPSYDTQFVYKWKESNTVYTGKGGGYKGFEVEAAPYMEFTLSRAYADKPTIYPGLNSNNVKTVLNEMGIASESYKPAKTRYGNKSEQSKRVSWTNTFTTNWVYQNVDDPTIQWEHDNHDWDSDLQTSNDGSYEEIKNTSSRYDIGQIKTYSSYYKVWNGTSWKKFRKSTYGSKSKARAAAEEYSNELKAQSNASATGGIGNLNTGYSQPNNTKILGLWGKVNNGLTKPGTDNYKFDLGGMNFYTRKSVLNTNNKITFYPYYQMVIEHLNMSSTPVYLTSENLSTLLNVDRVDTSVFKSGNGNGLKLQSYQWSMHARIQNNMAEFGIMDRDSFLPTGAIYTLATGKEAGAPDVWVGFRVLSTYVADKSKLASNTGINNESEVNTKISNFKTQVEKSLTNYEIVMHGAEGLSVDETNFYGDSAQLTGKVGAYKLAGQKMDTDPKYDLKSGGDGANRSDIDILDTIEETHDFKLESDVNGNITVSMDGNKLEVIPKGKTSFSNDVVKDLDDRTKVVTNYINALDRNMGSDRNNKSWYNEAWSELHVKDAKFAYKLGFGDGEALRSAALNIKLNGRLENRDDMYNLDKDTIKEKARTFRFYTSAKSTLNEAASKPAGWVGDYAGQQVVVPGIHELFTSKLFYTSNTTVQDLN